MQIRPIRYRPDHRAALAEIEKLWAASSEAPKGDKLGILVTLVETYEERFFWRLAEILGSRSLASEIPSRRHALTVKMDSPAQRSVEYPGCPFVFVNGPLKRGRPYTARCKFGPQHRVAITFDIWTNRELSSKM